jgi:hypothetical protein
MIALRNIETGEVQFVFTLDGIDPAVWEETGEPVPTDLESVAYAVQGETLAPVERRLTKPEFLDLWTPAETVAVMQSTDVTMAYLWARTLAWDGPFLLSDARVLAGIDQAETLELITPASAARKRAGLPPET